MSKYFISFGTTWNYENSIKRIKKQAEEMKVFDYIKIYTEKDLNKDINFSNKHKDFIENNKRGYGYWIWKSFITKKTLSIMEDGDYLVYADAGCYLNNNPSAIDRLNKYFTLCDRLQPANISFKLIGLPEKMYTKNDVFNYFNMHNDTDKNDDHLMATIFILKKCPITINLIDEYYNACSNYNLINDSYITLNDTDFKDHRHDQSVFSLLRKKIGTIAIKDETWYQDFNCPEASNIPILATRIRN
jgi:hypothetical protein